jgi:hypothetical protein
MRVGLEADAPRDVIDTARQRVTVIVFVAWAVTSDPTGRSFGLAAG